VTGPAEIQVVAYDAGWRQAFEVEADRVRATLGPLAQGVEHIGSTAVPGLAAKPVVDMMVGVSSEDAVEPAAGRLTALGYERLPAADFPGRTFMRRLDEAGRATHHLSLTVHAAGYRTDQLTLRDALRRDPSLVQRYAELKRELATRSADTTTYTGAKTDFLREVLLGAGHAPRTGWASEPPSGRPGRAA
jgi:GrpB-like predicted nucleotidyltransferase (UPF0157 family)